MRAATPRPFLSTPSARRATPHHQTIGGYHNIFLSTPSARRATQGRLQASPKRAFLSTPSARRATHAGANLSDAQKISIHALREEGDLRPLRTASRSVNFYPRPPRGGRPLCSRKSLRSGSNFYPRPPRGGRLIASLARNATYEFLSTPSARRATDGFIRTKIYF